MEIDTELERQIIGEYRNVFEYCQSHTVPPYMLEISRQWLEEERWRMYWQLLHSVPYNYNEKVIVDYGCKYGHLLPMFISLEARKAIGIDVDDEYVNAGSTLFQGMYSNVEIFKSEEGYVPLQSGTVDFVLVNEVISHVNPAFLETVYAEIARILKPGGKILISDGNNIEYAPCLEALAPLWNAWENGPDGAKTDRDIVTKSYLSRRKEIIRSRHPQLDDAHVDILAQNTSGLWGNFLIKIIDDYVDSGNLIRRPYRLGTSPTNPGMSGVMMERGFYAEQVVRSLESYGLDAVDASALYVTVNAQPVSTIIGLSKEMLRMVKRYIRSELYLYSDLYPQRIYKPVSANLTVVGTKRIS